MERLAQLHSKINLLCLIMILFGCSKPEKKEAKTTSSLVLNMNDARISNKNGIIYFNDQLFSGVIFSLYPSTTDTAASASYLNGKEHGRWVKYYPDRKLYEQRSFENGKKTGVLETWWPNGNKQTHYIFANDEYEGTCREWSSDGLLVKEMNYLKGYEEGSQRWWYDNGKIKANYIIKQGRRYGLLGTKNCMNVSDSIFKN
ncbi:toxin-antitoxin system YwqK family antitoxin [Lacibacter sediminis]|uniref:Toxin-antitoxin system YwqK family antitoxin n=1 Tax=Lacibacter sediminis TaxID=2760713 RepID=A0A7G5XKG1_9BACT|nr:toxin-antitoxin system YwqK family antitoxin [Lacibacter sediminis]QNA45964.1 toxin-antitoxin system YwqK family antitoxin [Lacibacter sediminis]